MARRYCLFCLPLFFIIPLAPTYAQLSNEESQDTRRTGGSSWSLSANITWTDNYRRLSGDEIRFDIDALNGVVGVADVEVETPQNVILSTALSGSGFVRKVGFTGFISGSVRVGGYLLGTDDQAKLVESSTPAPPFGTTPDENGNFSTIQVQSLSELFVVPDIVAAGTMTLKENLLFLDSSAQGTQSAIGLTSISERRSTQPGEDTVTFVGASLSPYLYREFTDQQTVELRLRGTAIVVANERLNMISEDPTDISENNDERFANDSYSTDLSTAYSTGNMLGKTAFGASAIARYTKEQGSDLLPELEIVEYSGRLDAARAISNAMKLAASVGYDNISINFDNSQDDNRREDDLSGVYWRFGIDYTPSRRFNFSLAGGERYGGGYISGRLNSQLTKRLSFALDAERSLSTGSQQAGSVLNGLQTRSRSVLDTLTRSSSSLTPDLIRDTLGVQPLGRTLDQPFRSGLFVFDRYSASFLYEMTRTRFGLGALWSTAGSGSSEQDVLTLSVFANRQLNRRLSFSTGYSLGMTEGFGLDGTNSAADRLSSTEQFTNASLNYRLDRGMSATAGVTHATNEADGVDVLGLNSDFDETTVSMGVNWEF